MLLSHIEAIGLRANTSAQSIKLTGSPPANRFDAGLPVQPVVDATIGCPSPPDQTPLKKQLVASAWRSYASIESTTNQQFLRRMQALAVAVGEECEWVATEKVHGANFSFETDGISVQHASRTHKLGERADFYNSNATMPRYHPCVLEAFRLAKQSRSDIKCLVIYGEYFGGYYPGYPAVPGMKKVQGGVAYSPDHHFYAFDVCTDGTSYFDFDEARQLLMAAGFPLVASPIRRGALPDVLAIDVEVLETSLPDLLGHPVLDRFRIAEGVVIRPVHEQPRQEGQQRSILKKKAQAFWEATNQPGMAAKFRTLQTFCSSDKDALLFDVGRTYLTENRLRAVISKNPELLQEGQQIRLAGLLTKDVCEELEKHHKEELLALGKSVGGLKKAMNILAKKFVEATVGAIRADVG